MSKLQEIENQIKREVDHFRSEVKKIHESPDPVMQDEAKRQYEIGLKKEELDAKVAELKAKYQETAATLIAEAEKEARLSSFSCGEYEKKPVDARINDYIIDVALAHRDEDKHEAFAKFEKTFEYFTPAQLAHVRSRLPEVVSKVNGDKTAMKQLRGLNGVLSQLKTPEQERFETIKTEASSGGDIAYRQLKMTHPTYQE